MPRVTDVPPPEIQSDLEDLNSALDEAVPPRVLDRNLLIATWNVRAFGGLTEKWVATESDSPKRDLQSLRTIADWLDRWAQDTNRWDHNLIALGDFNIDRMGDERYGAFTSTGIEVPEDLHDVPRTLFSDPSNPNTGKFYDQIAWFTEESGRPALSLVHNRSGYFDFRDVALPRRDLSNFQLSWRISDHYPLWTEFDLD